MRGKLKKYCKHVAVLLSGAVGRSRTGDLLLRFHRYFGLRPISGLDCILSLPIPGLAPLVSRSGVIQAPRSDPGVRTLTVIRDSRSGFPGRGRGLRPTMELLYQLSYNGILYTMNLTKPGTCFW